MLLIAALSVALPGLWGGAGGRDFRPQATNAAVLFFAFAIILRRKFLWRAGDFLFALFFIEAITLAVIGHFSGSQGLDSFDYFNLHWLAFMNLFIGLPWLGGYALAVLWPKRREG